MTIPNNEHQVMFYSAPNKNQYYIITQVNNTLKYVLYEANSVGVAISKLKTAETPTDFAECYT